MKVVVVEYGRDEERGASLIPCDTVEEARDTAIREETVASMLGQDAYVSIRDMTVSEVLQELRLDSVY